MSYLKRSVSIPQARQVQGSGPRVNELAAQKRRRQLLEDSATVWPFYSKTLSDRSGNYTFSLTRGDPATYVGTDGYLVEVPAGVARFESSPGGGAAMGLLHEDAQTNLLTYSEDLSTGWSVTRLTASDDSSTSSPTNGDAKKLTVNAVGGTCRIQDGMTVSNATLYCLSIYIKYGSLTANASRLMFDQVVNSTVDVTWTDGVPAISASANVDSTGIEAHVGGWYRLWLVCTSDTTAVNAIWYPDFGTTTVDDYMFVGCIQCEQVPYADSKPTSWIPTISTSEDRARDDWNFPADKSFITAQGVCYMESTIQRAETDKYWLSTENGASTVLLRFQASSGTQITFRYDPTVAAARTDIAGTVSGGFSLEPTMQKTALSWDTGSGEIIPYAKGAACGTPGTNAAEMDSSLLTTGDLASVLGTKPPYRMIIRELRFYGESKTAAELATLTT